MYIAASMSDSCMLVGQREKLTGQMPKLAGKCPVTGVRARASHTIKGSSNGS